MDRLPVRFHGRNELALPQPVLLSPGVFGDAGVESVEDEDEDGEEEESEEGEEQLTTAREGEERFEGEEREGGGGEARRVSSGGGRSRPTGRTAAAAGRDARVACRRLEREKRDRDPLHLFFQLTFLVESRGWKEKKKGRGREGASRLSSRYDFGLNFEQASPGAHFSPLSTTSIEKHKFTDNRPLRWACSLKLLLPLELSLQKEEQEQAR